MALRGKAGTIDIPPNRLPLVAVNAFTEYVLVFAWWKTPF